MEIGSIQSRVDAISKAFGEKPAVVNNKTSKEEIQARVDAIKEFTGLKDNVKNDAKSITSINDIFGALKKSEKTIGKIEKVLDGFNGNNGVEVGMKISELASEATYKEKQLLSSVPLKSGSFDALSLIEGELNMKNPAGFKEKLGLIDQKIKTDLSEVKQEIKSKTNVLGSSAQSSMDKSGMDVDLASITKSSNMDYLKQQMKGLLG